MTMAGKYMQRPSELARRLDPSRLLGHFALGRSLPPEPPRWQRRQVGGWTLVHEPSLPALELHDSDGVPIGWVVGHLIDLQAETLVTGPLRAPVDGEAGAAGPSFEDWLYEFAGRFVVIVLGPRPRLYPDGGASLPVLFSAALERAASSPFLLSAPDGTIPDSPLVDMLSLFEADSCFTLGATSHAQADLLLANHVLSLDCWEQSRIWPPAHFDFDDVGSLVERVATTLEKTISSVTATGCPNVGLTAGGDCRVFVACSRRVLDRVRFFTAAFPDELGVIDLATAPTLAERFCLQHRILPWLEPSLADIELFMYRTGCLAGEQRGRRAAPTYNQLGGSEVYISSVGAEISRAIGRQHFDKVNVRLTPRALIMRFGLELNLEYLRRAADWLAKLPEGLSRLNALTLFYAEMDNYAWGGPLTTAYPEAYSFALYPYTHRAVLDAIFRLPNDYRLSGRLREDIIAARWPELLKVPINRPPVWVTAKRIQRRFVSLAKSALSWRAWNRLLERTLRDFGMYR